MSQSRPTKHEVDVYSGHYVLHGEQSNAWRVTFPKSKAKAEVVHVKASALHSMAKIQVRIKELSEKVRVIAEKEFSLDAQYVARRLKEIDELDVLDIMMDDLKSFKSLSEWPKVWRISISSIDMNRTISKGAIETIIEKIKWPDKTKNLELIGKLTKVSAFSENFNIKGGSEVTPWGNITAGVDE